MWDNKEGGGYIYLRTQTGLEENKVIFKTCAHMMTA